MAPDANPPRPSRFGLLLALVGLVAFAIREHFVLASVVDVPIRGDIREYVAYAWNLVHHGVYSHTFPQVVAPAADAYRSPGYPWLLTLCMSVFPQGSEWVPLRGWYPLALQLQVLLGTATALLTTLLARQWLAPTWAILAGFLLALWPHHIAATLALMPEVLFGFLLVAGLYCFAKGWARRHPLWFAATGVVFGYAYLVNPLIALFPPCLAFVLWLKRERMCAVLLLGLYVVPMAALAVRDARLDDSAREKAGRATVNFVQGSWPDYHNAYLTFRRGHPVGMAVMDEINRETQLLHQDPREGLHQIARRFGSDPLGYAAWYALHKPMLLWDWNIRLGVGVSVQEVKRSPLDTSPILRGWTNVLRVINPSLSLLMLLTAMASLIGGLRHNPLVPAAITGALAVYVTLIHVLLQAEPRYATAYRGIEAVLLMTAFATLVHLVKRLRDRRSPPTSAPPQAAAQ